MGHVLLRFVSSTLPLALTPLLGLLIAEGYLNFGGGEKDLLLLIPWLVWSSVYLVFFSVFSWKRVSIRRGLAYAVGGATGVLTIVYLVMLVWFSGLLGVTTP